MHKNEHVLGYGCSGRGLLRPCRGHLSVILVLSRCNNSAYSVFGGVTGYRFSSPACTKRHHKFTQTSGNPCTPAVAQRYWYSYSQCYCIIVPDVGSRSYLSFIQSTPRHGRAATQLDAFSLFFQFQIQHWKGMESPPRMRVRVPLKTIHDTRGSPAVARASCLE